MRTITSILPEQPQPAAARGCLLHTAGPRAGFGGRQGVKGPLRGHSKAMTGLMVAAGGSSMGGKEATLRILVLPIQIPGSVFWSQL